MVESNLKPGARGGGAGVAKAENAGAICTQRAGFVEVHRLPLMRRRAVLQCSRDRRNVPVIGSFRLD